MATSVRDFMFVETREVVTRLRLPEMGFVLGVRSGGAARFVDDDSTIPALSLTGVSRHARAMETSGGGAVVLARFNPGGAARIFGPRLHEFFGRTEALDELFPRSEVDRLHTRISEASTDHARAAMLEAFLLQHTRREGDPLVDHALRRIHDNPSLRIRALAREAGLSHDAFEKRFRREVGCAPKQYASLARVHAALRLHRPERSLTQLALEAGYFDQPHFNREFRAMVGVAPGAYLRARADG